MISLAAVNQLSDAEFVASFGDVAEHAPWVAEAAGAHRPFATRAGMIDAFTQTVLNEERARQQALICAHPDLATRAKLTADSSREQQGVGLDRLTTEEFARFTTLNTAYRTRFGFPFIFAVKGATKHQILEAFAARMSNSPETEFETALGQVCRIIAFRLEDRVSP